ncbi:MAG: UDP-glucose 4-epimerase [Solirubrobacterales bacterium]|nr:MAG: UDP-glucose 4-epimerase [Solirubrobacterales bacterium]
MTRAIVTGGAGFIGSHVVEALLEARQEVTVIDDLSSGDPRRVAPGADFRRLDIVDRSALDAVIDEVRPEAIFHLAAQASVTVSVSDPARDCTVNVLGTLNLLEAASRYHAPVVFTSTGGALYGDDAPIPTPEDRIPVPVAPYGASKWAAEAYVKTWSVASGVPHSICRLGNVYGPRQSPHGEAGVVSIFAHHLYKGRPPRIFGYGKPTRDYVHVADVVAALRSASGKRGIFNIATGIETDVMSVWHELQRASGVELEPELAPLRAGELERSCLDSSLAQRELGWRARVSLSEGLPETYHALIAEFERDGQDS